MARQAETAGNATFWLQKHHSAVIEEGAALSPSNVENQHVTMQLRQMQKSTTTHYCVLERWEETEDHHDPSAIAGGSTKAAELRAATFGKARRDNVCMQSTSYFKTALNGACGGGPLGGDAITTQTDCQTAASTLGLTFADAPIVDDCT